MMSFDLVKTHGTCLVCLILSLTLLYRHTLTLNHCWACTVRFCVCVRVCLCVMRESWCEFQITPNLVQFHILLTLLSNPMWYWYHITVVITTFTVTNTFTRQEISQWWLCTYNICLTWSRWPRLGHDGRFTLGSKSNIYTVVILS